MVFANVRNIRWNYFRNIYGQAVLNVDCTKLTTKGVVQGAFVGCKHQSGEVIFNRKVKVIVIKNESTNRPIRLGIISNDGLAIDPADLFFSGLYYWTIGVLYDCNRNPSKWKWHPKAYLIAILQSTYVLMMSKSSTMNHWCCRFFSISVK